MASFDDDDVTDDVGERMISIQMADEDQENKTEILTIPINITQKQLQIICNSLLKNEEQEIYSFFLNEKEITENLEKTILNEKVSTENAITIIYQPQAAFKVRAVTRCSSSIEGHSEAILVTQFSPDSSFLATGSGDTTLRFWDLNTETPKFVGKFHKSEILCVAWSPDGFKVASGCKQGQICIWNPENGKPNSKSLQGHKQWITSICWKPLHLDPSCRILASSSKDATIRIWDSILSQCLRTLSSHLQSVRCLRWSGEDLIYSGSSDCTMIVWRPDDGVICRKLMGHGHWINSLALNTDYVMRTGSFEPSIDSMTSLKRESAEVRQQKALKRYENVKKMIGGEMMVSGSDDFTLTLWKPSISKKSLIRMTGHQAIVNDVRFSPDARIIASASFDKSVKLWNGKNGKFITTLRGHVSSVYQVAWSADSRLLVSGSSDSTLKVWDVGKTKKLLNDLPGHADEVFALDWSSDGSKVASGGRDKVLKIWRR